MAQAKKKATNKKEEKSDGTTQKSNQAAVQADSKGKEVGAKTAKKDKKPTPTADKPENLEEPVTAESDVTEAAIDAAEQEGTVIAEKRSTSPVAKAGKRSTKALKEAEEKEAKEQRKAEGQTAKAEGEKPAPRQKPRTAEDRLKARGKKYREAFKLVDNTKDYDLKDALDLAIKTSTTNFDASVELHVKLGVDPKHADQNIRGNLVLPSGTGKTSRVAVFADADDAAKAKKAGADIAGSDELTAKLDKGAIDFDTLIATPAMMSQLGKYARVLGPKGLMPNPKSGTVTSDITKAVQEAKSGKVDYRVDSTGIVHCSIGKVSFGAAKLLANAQAVLGSIKTAKPSSLKGNYVHTIHLATSMGPAVKVNPAE